MNSPLTPESPTSPLAPVFTLGSALRWLGHDCPHRRCCSPQIDTMDASVWFLRRGRQSRTFPLETRIVVNPVGTVEVLASALQMIHRVNWCTRRDGIEVRHQALSVAPVTVLSEAVYPGRRRYFS